MNALNRNIQINEVVVLKKHLFKPEYQGLEERLFRVLGGFGMCSDTIGSALMGEFVSDGEKCRYDGRDIDVDETVRYQMSKQEENKNVPLS